MGGRKDRDFLFKILDLLIRILVGVIAVLVFLYSLLIAGQLLLGILLDLILILTYFGARYLIRTFRRKEDAQVTA